jgi:hypothetical protein
MCVLVCLDGRVLSMLDPSKIDPPWISPNLLALLLMRSLQSHPLIPSSTLKISLDEPSLWMKKEDGQKHRGRIVELIEDHESKVEDNPNRIKFRVSVNEDKAEEIITYNKMLEYITKDEESDIQWVTMQSPD